MLWQTFHATMPSCIPTVSRVAWPNTQPIDKPIPSLSRHRFSPIFVFFTVCPSHAAGPITMLDGSKHAVSAKEVPLGGLNNRDGFPDQTYHQSTVE